MTQRIHNTRPINLDDIAKAVQGAAHVQASRLEGLKSKQKLAVVDTLVAYAKDVATLLEEGYMRDGGDAMRGILPKMLHGVTFLRSIYRPDDLSQGEALFNNAVTKVMSHGASREEAVKAMREMTVSTIAVYSDMTHRPAISVIPRNAGISDFDSEPERLNIRGRQRYSGREAG